MGPISADAIEAVDPEHHDLSSTPVRSLHRALGADWAGHGRVDYLAAVQQIGPQLVTAPAPALSGSTATPASTGTVDLNWTANLPRTTSRGS